MRKTPYRLPSSAAAAVLTLGVLASPAAANTRFEVTNLVSDGFVPAANVDPSLVNPWGVAYAPTGPFWVSDNGSGLATLYGSTGSKLGLTVSVAPPSGAAITSSPTGQVFNPVAGAFQLTSAANSSADFIFDTEDGTISAWSPKVSVTNSVLEVDNSDGGAGAVYKGLAIANDGGQEVLYASNFRGGDVEVYNSHFSLISTFTDPTVSAGYAPFGIQVLDGHLFVTFALQDAAKHDDVAGAGNGYVDEFNLDGTFDKRIVSLGGQIDSPWGLDIAPASFGTFAGDLLVGNFGDGTISAFNPASGAFEGQLDGVNGQPLVLGDLWALINGNGGAGGDASKVYFTSGVMDEAHGLFGSIAAVPEPSSWAMMIVGAGLIGAHMRRRRAIFAAEG